MIKRIFSVALFCTALVMISCTKDPTAGTGPGGAGGSSKQGDALTKVAEGMAKDMGEMLTSEGFVATARVAGKITSSDAFNFGGFSGGNKTNYSKGVFMKLKRTIGKSIMYAATPRIVAQRLSERPSILGNKFNKSSDEDTLRFNFSDHTGIYQWNDNTEEWETVGSSSYMVFRMNVDVPDPQDTSVSYNKTAELTLYYWNETMFSILNTESNEYEENWLPTGIKINLTLDGEEVASFNFAANYNPQTMMPVTLSAQLLLSPFALTVNHADGGQNITSSISLTKSGAVLIGFGASIDMANRGAGDALNMDEDDDIDNTEILFLRAYAQVSTMKIELTVDVAAMENLNNPSPSDLNGNVQFMITNNGQPIGTIEFADDPDCQSDTCDPVIKIVFEDGTTGELDEYFGDIFGTIDSLINGDENTDTNNRMAARVRSLKSFRR